MKQRTCGNWRNLEKALRGEGGLFKKIWSPQNAPAAQGLESKQFDWWNKSEDSGKVEKLN